MLIGISGKLGSGKDTVAELIMKNCSPIYGWKTKSFAYKLKQITSMMMGVPLEDCFSQEGKNKYVREWRMTIGEFQQKLGTDGMRNNVHKNAWVLGLFADYFQEDWIVTDARFPNEAEAIKKYGGYMIRVDGDPISIRANSTRNLFHESETALDNWGPWDFMIDNSGTLLELEEQVNEFLEMYFELA